jgi:hypothetical protein
MWNNQNPQAMFARPPQQQQWQQQSVVQQQNMYAAQSNEHQMYPQQFAQSQYIGQPVNVQQPQQLANGIFM